MALQSLRDALASQRWLAYVVVGALGLIFAAWGAYGIVNFNVGQTTYAAEAGGQTVSLDDARREWLSYQEQAHLGNVDLPPAVTAELQNQVLEGLIRRALIAERTQKLGYRVTEQDLTEAIRQEPAFQFNGQYSPEIAKAALAQSGMSLDAYEDTLRSRLESEQLEGGIQESEFVTPAELEREHALQSQEREVRYAVLPADKYEPTAPPSDAAVQAYYKFHQQDFMQPEWAHLEYGELSLEQLMAKVNVSDADLKAAYDKQKARLEQPERRHAHHILITVGKGGDAAAKKLAEEVLAQAKAGKDFGELAKKYSQDPGSAQNGGDLGWADRTAYVKPFADALFSMSPGEIRGPVKTEFGYHIIRLDAIQAGKTKSVEEAKPELEAQIRKDRATDEFGDIQEKLQSGMEEPGASLDALVKEFGLQKGEVARFLRGAGGAPLGAASEVQDIVFGDSPVQVGHMGGPVILGNDKLVIVKVLDRHPRAPKPLAEVRDTIVAAIKKEQGTEAAMKVAEAARAKLIAGTAFDDVLKELKVPADPARFVSRNDPSILPELRQAAFQAPKPEGKPVYETVRLDSGGAAVLEVTRIRIPPPDKSKAISAAEQAAEREGLADSMAYELEVRRTAKVVKNPNAFQ